MSCPQIRQAYRPQKYQAPKVDKRYEVRKSIGRQREKLNRFRMPVKEFTLFEKVLAAVAGGSIAGAGIAAAGGVGHAAGDNGMVIQDSCGVADYHPGELYHFKEPFTGNDYYSTGGVNFSTVKYCKAGNAGSPEYGFMKFLFGDKVKNIDKAKQKMDACPEHKADIKYCSYVDRIVKADFKARLVNNNIKDNHQYPEFEVEGDVGPPDTSVEQINPLLYIMLPFIAIAAGLAARRHRRKAS